ncbi:MAG: SMI1/KNR4 family protein [Lentisphaeraceae bacterium]|nr:SMI1/KNR4 family protein [Lentisphaeraceae bacterium]
MNLTEIENYLGAKLPQEYLAELNNGSKYEIEYKEWVLFSEEELKREINLSGNKMPYFKILEGHFIDSEGFSFPNRTKLKTAVAISDENSDILFFDKKLQVYIYFLSSQEVIKVAKSFKELEKYKIKPKSLEKVESPQFYGSWEPDSSTTHEIEFIKKFFPSYSFEKDGKGFRSKKSKNWKKNITWSAIKNTLDERLCLCINDEEEIYISNLTNETFLYSNDDKTLQVTYKKVEV